ncbi:flagellar biosynthesis anti-sigma factor FlgM [Eubacteriales bacterium OttesenSCG-928-N14]|nr:flagellar biosynthesis anti-sigma factor FlgM [Eubacteriales bacterium OttesenSCG-928-N14]
MMKVSGIYSPELLQKYVHVKGKGSVQAGAQLGSDTVEISDDALTFANALKAAKEVMNGKRTSGEVMHLNEVKEQVQNGTYNVPGYRIAQKMLGEE